MGWPRSRLPRWYAGCYAQAGGWHQHEGDPEMADHDDDGCGRRWGWPRRGPGGGPPWLRGGPFGPFGPFGPATGRPGRMFGQGDLRLLLLALLADGPSHGYDLMRTIEAKFGGAYSPSPGAIYPTLTLLEEQDLIAPVPGGGSRKSYAVTDKGRQFLADSSAQLEALMARLDILAGGKAAGPPPDGVMEAVLTLRHAILARTGAWTPAEEKRVRDLLLDTARRIARGDGG